MPDIQWLWPGWLPRGFVTLLAGRKGEGKTSLALDIMKRLLCADPMPDGQTASRIEEAVWIETEAGHGILASRAQKIGIPLDRVILPSSDPLADMQIDEPRDRMRLEALMSERSPALVVLDSWRGAQRAQEKDSGPMGELMKWAAKQARDHNAAILVTHHMRKKDLKAPANQETTLDDVRGSNAITAQARMIWTLDGTGGDRRRLSVICTNLCAKPGPLELTVTDRIAWSGLSKHAEPPLRPRERAAKFLRVLLSDGPVETDRVLAKGVGAGHSESALRDALRELGGQSLKSSDGPWRWTLEPPSPPSPPSEAKEPSEDVEDGASVKVAIE